FDLLPPGVNFDGSVPAADVFTNNVLEFHLGTLGPGEGTNISIQIGVNPTVGATYTNTAFVTTFSADAVLTNNMDVAISVVPSLSGPFVDNAAGPTNVTDDSAWLEGTLQVTGSAATAVSVYWGATDGGTTNSAWDNVVHFGLTGDTPPVPYSTQVTGLTQDSTYYYRYYATNAAGEAWATSSTVFRTEAWPVVNNAGGATFLGIGTARLNGEMTAATGALGRVYWGTTDGGTDPSAWAHVENLGFMTNGPFFADVTGVLYGAVHYYRVYATNEFGEGWATNSTAFATFPPPDFEIRNGPVNNLTPTSATLNVILNIPGSVVDLTLYWGTSNAGTNNPGGWDFEIDLSGYTNLSNVSIPVPVNGLVGNTLYHYSFRGQNLFEDTWTVPGTFIAGASPGAFAYRSRITFCGYTPPVAETLNNFPVLVQISPATIAGFNYGQLVSGLGNDLRFFDSTETKELAYEIEDWNPFGTSYVWVQVPELVNNASHIYAYWGNANATIPAGYTSDGSTWSEGFTA
ncbi:MAG: DUF2341 domain-containing protein, partial [Verrucomicrobiota bacterium]